jgi:3-ketosteroid 9alpha-monooxygenase subunit B
MAVSMPSIPAAGTGHDRGYHTLRIAAVVAETDDAATFVLDVPPDLQSAYAYRAGQFLTFRVQFEARTLYRSYSMSSAPEVDAELAVTVKRVPGGAVSNWMLDRLSAGDTVDVSAPAGVFQLTGGDRDVVTFAAGSGITPIMSLLKDALASSSRMTQLLYANRDPDSVIFAAALADLVQQHGEQLAVVHHYDRDHGFVTEDTVAAYLDAARRAEVYICGPAAFMDIVERALLSGGVPGEQIHIERFTVPGTAPREPASVARDEDAGTSGTQVTIELDGQTKSGTHHPGTTILQTARQLGMSPPYSCESGTCATCMAKLVDGEVTMHVNDALFEDEVADGWILTCQSVPTTPAVHVVYGYEDT